MFNITRHTLCAALVVLSLAGCKSDGEDDVAAVEPVPLPDPVDGFVFQIENTPDPKVVNRRMAGANYLHTRDYVEGTFGIRSEELGITYLRWPGGAIAEDEAPYHDTYFTNGDARNWDTFQHDEHWALANVNEYAESRGMDLMIVLPTKKYLTSPGQIDEAAIRREIGPFVQQLTRGRFGRVPDLLEIGNEFYWGSDQMEAEDYASIAKVMIDEIRSHQSQHIDIAVQGGRLGKNEIGRVAAAFPSDIKDQVNYIADHVYTRNSDWTNYDTRFGMYQDNWGPKPLLISEWNVKSTNDGDLDVYAWGIEQAAPMVQVWDAMVKNRAIATFWAVQQNTMTSAYPNEGVDEDTDMYIGGRTLRWLNDTIGMTRYNAIQRGEDGMLAHAYRTGPEMIVFVSGLNAGEQEVTLQFSGIVVTDASARSMSGEVDVSKQVPQINQIPLEMTQGEITFTINRNSPHELVRLDLRVSQP